MSLSERRSSASSSSTQTSLDEATTGLFDGLRMERERDRFDPRTTDTSSEESRSSTVGGIFISDILGGEDIVFVDELISDEFAELLAPRKFPLKTLREISESTSPHANNARNNLFGASHNYQLLAEIIWDALKGDGHDPPPLCATDQESIDRRFCGFTCEPTYSSDSDDEQENLKK